LKKSRFPVFGFPGRADLALGRAKRRLSEKKYQKGEKYQKTAIQRSRIADL
jgi:hypothetical protein